MRKMSILLLIFCTCFALAGEHHARPQWRNKIIEFDAPGAGTGSGQGTLTYTVNWAGVSTGAYIDSSGVWHGYVRTPGGKITEFDAPGAGTNGYYGQGTDPLGINLAGAITGNLEDSNNVYHGFLRYPDGTFTDFDAPDAGKTGDPYYQGTFPISINEEGAVTGFYQDSNNVFHGFVRDPYGTITEWDPPDAGKGAWQGTQMFWVGHHINLEGAITGYYIDSNSVYHGFLRHLDGTFTEFEPPGGGEGPGPVTYAHTVTPDGWINGTYQDLNYVYHPYVRRPDGTFIEFKVPGAGTGNSQGAGSHDSTPDHVLAGVFADDTYVWHGYVRTPEGKITEFDAPGAGTGPGQGTYVYGISSAGVIAGAYMDANGVYHGFLRLP